MFHVTGVSFPFFPSFLFSPWEVCALPDGGKDRNCVCKCVENTDMHTHVYVYAYVYFSLIFCKELEVLMLSFPFSSFFGSALSSFLSLCFLYFLVFPPPFPPHLSSHLFIFFLTSSRHSPFPSHITFTHHSSSPPSVSVLLTPHPSLTTHSAGKGVCVCLSVCTSMDVYACFPHWTERERESCLWSV